MKHTPDLEQAQPLQDADLLQKVVSFRLSNEEIARCKKYAHEQVRSVSSFIRMLAMHGLAHFEAEREASKEPAPKAKP